MTISGRVQGVFFRAHARRHAEDLQLTGFTENLADGTIRIVAEGQEERLRAFVEWCRKGPPFASVEDVAVEWQPAQGTFRDFHIR